MEAEGDVVVQSISTGLAVGRGTQVVRLCERLTHSVLVRISIDNSFFADVSAPLPRSLHEGIFSFIFFEVGVTGASAPIEHTISVMDRESVLW